MRRVPSLTRTVISVISTGKMDQQEPPCFLPFYLCPRNLLGERAGHSHGTTLMKGISQKAETHQSSTKRNRQTKNKHSVTSSDNNVTEESFFIYSLWHIIYFLLPSRVCSSLLCYCEIVLIIRVRDKSVLYTLPKYQLARDRMAFNIIKKQSK